MTVATEMTVLPVALPPVIFDPSPVGPSPGGLYSAVVWPPEDGPPRWLAGVQVWPRNYAGALSSGVWRPGWNAREADLTPADSKLGVRPAAPQPFYPVTVTGSDSCDPSSRDEVLLRAELNLRLNEQQDVEREFAVRLLADAGAAPALGIVAAVARLDGLIARTGTVGVIHASAEMASYAAAAQVLRSGNLTPAGNRWVFGGGYVDGLGLRLVATSPLFGWRTAPVLRSVLEPFGGQVAAVVERSVLVGYERALGAATVIPTTGGNGSGGDGGGGGGGTQPYALVEDPPGSGMWADPGAALVEDPAGSGMYADPGAVLPQQPPGYVDPAGKPAGA